MSREDLEKRLARVDFSGDSRIEASLRARLLSGGRKKPRLEVPLAVAFAAVVVIALFLPRKAPSRSYPVDAVGLPILPGAFPAKAAARPEPVFETRPVTIDDIFVRRRI